MPLRSGRKPQPLGASDNDLLLCLGQDAQLASIGRGRQRAYPKPHELVAAEGVDVRLVTLGYPRDQIIELVALDTDSIERDQDIARRETRLFGRPAGEHGANFGGMRSLRQGPSSSPWTRRKRLGPLKYAWVVSRWAARTESSHA